MRLFLLAAALAGAPAALGHGVQTEPPSRHEEVCGHRFSGDSIMRTGCTGGGGTFGFGGGTAGRGSTLCGDGCMRSDDSQAEFGATDFKSTPCLAEPTVYTEGADLRVEWIINAMHGGHIRCNLCPDANNLSDECFNEYPLTTVGPSTGGEDADAVRRHPRGSMEGQIPGNYDWWIWYGRDSVNPVRQHFKLPDGVTSELATVQCIWWTAHLCVYPCEEELCGAKYAAGFNNIAWPEDHHNGGIMRQCVASNDPAELREDSPFPENPDPAFDRFKHGADLQMYAQCGEIRIVANGEETTSPPDDVEIDETTTSPSPPDDVEIDETTTSPDVEEEEMSPSPSPTPTTSPSPTVEEEEMDAPPSGNGNFEGLAIIDVESGATIRLTHMGSDNVDLSDYPEGLGIRAEFVDNDIVESVKFVTDDGFEHTEYHNTYDMFGYLRGNMAWPGLEPGLLVKITVTALMTDGTEEEWETTIDFQETFGQR